MVSKKSYNAFLRFHSRAESARKTGNVNELRQELRVVFDHIKQKNDRRRELLNKLEPKAKELREAIKTGNLNNEKMAEIKELSRQIAQIAKGREP